MSAIKAVELLAAGQPGVVSLAQGIPSFDTPEPIKQAAIAAIRDGRAAAYSLTYGLAELRQTIACELGEAGMDYDPDHEIVVTCGGAEAIAATLRALITDGRREVIVPAPSYASYPEMVRTAGGSVRYVALDEANGWALDPAAVAAVMGPETAAVLLANPNNPTGHCYPEEQLRAVAELAQQHGCKLICDEVYKDFVFDGGSAYTPAAEPAYRDIVIRIFSFSKAYGMTGWRVAYVHGAAEVMDRVVGVHDNLVTCAPVVSQYAAMAAVTEGAPYVREFRAVLARRRDELCRWLDQYPDVFAYQKPNSAYFVFPRLVSGENDWDFVRAALAEAGVAAVPGVAFGPSGAGHIRLCFGRSDADMRLACERLDRWLARRRSPYPNARDAVKIVS
ncbi:MAG TPA: pyridoxal phosphate-dependent aminotransferase [Candidatus Saccharimonadia bacterium]|nr:pyridoxal phosphate-dependent aminotransferase [Candidatus Saccharimonadia bacterium]